MLFNSNFLRLNLSFAFLLATMSANAVWMYDSGTSTITKNGVSINVGVWNGTRLSIVDNRNRTDIVELDFTDGIEDETGKAYTIQQINGRSGFEGCINLERVVLSDATASVGENAFKSCVKLQEFVMGTGCNAIGWNAFNGCTSLVTFTVPENSLVSNLQPGAFINCSSMTSFPFANFPNLTTIGNNAFNGCSLLATADLSPCTRLATFGEGVFQNCASLTSVVFPQNCQITSIGNNAFKDCPLLQAIDLSVCPNLTTIGSSAFSGCRSFTAVDLSGCSSLTTIGGSAFGGCTALGRVDMPASLTSLAQGAFSSHGSLATPGVSMLHVWFLSCPVADSAKNPFSNMFSATTDYTVTDTDMENASVTIHVPRTQASAGSPNWNTYAAQWQALADASVSWNTDATRKIFSLPDAADGSTLWVTDWRKTGNTWNDAAVHVAFWDDPVQVEISGPVYVGKFVRRGYTTADFSATLMSYDIDSASFVDFTVTLYTDAAHNIEAAHGTAMLSVLGSSVDISVSGLCEGTTYYAVLSGVDSKGVSGDPVDLGSLTTIWDEDIWTFHSDKGTLEKGWIVVSNVTANGTALTIAANSNTGDAEIPALDFTGGIRDGYELVAVGASAFASCTALTNVVLPASVTTVGGDAFRYDTALLSFAAPGPVSIGSYCFYQNGTITNAYLPNAVALNMRSFQNCTALRTIGTDLSSVRSLGQEALSNCRRLEGELVVTNCTSFGTWVFSGSGSFTSAILGEGVTRVTANTFSACDSLTNVVVRGEISAIDNSAFASHGPYNSHCSVPGHLNIYLTNVPDSLGNPFNGQYWNGNMASINPADSTIVVHIPYYNGVIEGQGESDGTTEKFAQWARAWQQVNLEGIVARGCPATGFALPQTKTGSGYWRNDVDYNTAAYVVRLAYYTDPNKKSVGLKIIVR